MTALASRAAEALDITAKIENRDYRDLANVTIFEEIDRVDVSVSRLRSLLSQ